MKSTIYNTQEDSFKKPVTNDRYIIIASSVSGHCCFEYSVIDTEEGKIPQGNYWEKTVCETFTKEDALMICDALNDKLS